MGFFIARIDLLRVEGYANASYLDRAVSQPNDEALSLYLSHRGALVTYASGILGDRAQAEDVVQEAWLRFAGRAPGGEGVRQPLAYLYRVVRNTAVDCLRRLSAEERRNEAGEILSDPDRQAPSPEEIALGRDHLRLVAAALSELPERNRRAFELQRFEGLSFQQIAQHLEVSPATAHRLARDAMVHVMGRLQGAQG